MEDERMQKKLKIKKSPLFQQKFKELSKKDQRIIEEGMEKVRDNPYIGEPMSEEDILEATWAIMEQRFEITPDEVISMFLSNDYFSKKNPEKIMMELSGLS